MLTPKDVLLAALAVMALAYAGFWLAEARRRRTGDRATPTPALFGIGFLTDFLDTLGIGSFAVTTSLYRLSGRGRPLVADQDLPGTLNAGHALPTVAQALIYITIIQVGFTTLVLMIAGAVAGAWLGAGIVSSLPRRRIQAGMGVAMLVAATLIVASLLGRNPAGGQALALHGGTLLFAVAVNAVLGALMTLGIGLYAPCMILVSLLGMDPTAAFPIMMGSCAFLMPTASLRFIRRGRYDLRAAAGLALGGIPGVLIAAWIVRSLPLDVVRWLVVVVVVYTGTTLLRAARAAEPAPLRQPAN